MGNVSSSRRRHQQNPPPPPPRPPPPPPAAPYQPQNGPYMFAANAPYHVPYAHADPYPPPHPAYHSHQPFYHHYNTSGGGGSMMGRQNYPPPQGNGGGAGPWSYSMRSLPPPWSMNPPPALTAPPPPTQSLPPPYVEHNKTTTIRNDVNLKKETLRLERDKVNPEQFLVAFTYDSMVSGSISIFFFAKEGTNCSLTALKQDIFTPIKVPFEKGLGQPFCQPPGTGIDLSFLEEAELTKEGPDEMFPLVIRAEACMTGETTDASDDEQIGNPLPKSVNAQITQAVLEKKDNGEYRVKVIKQILWIDGVRYELQEIYGIGSSAGTDFDANDPGKECVICMSEPRDTTVLPCRHMCMCSECAKLLRLQTNRCPICRRPVERLMEIKLNKTEE